MEDGLDATLARIDMALEALNEARDLIADCREVVDFHTTRDSGTRSKRGRLEAVEECQEGFALALGGAIAPHWTPIGPLWVQSRLETGEEGCRGTVCHFQELEWATLLTQSLMDIPS